MTRKSISKVFAVAGAALVLCGILFGNNGGIMTLTAFVTTGSFEYPSVDDALTH